jgi:hypothetical protein
MKKILIICLFLLPIISCSAINRIMIPYEEHQACALKGRNGLCGSITDVYIYQKDIDINKMRETRNIYDKEDK